jgi:Ca2+-binding RTX toxin-like protein
VLAALVTLPAGAYATEVSFDAGAISILSGANGADLEVSVPAPGTVRVVEAGVDDDLTAGLNCTEPVAETVECSGVGIPVLYYYGGSSGDTVDVQDSVTFHVELYGYGGPDVLLGGAGNDRLGGGTGDDDLDGRGGSDLVENGYDDSAQPTSSDGADTYRDTGASGTDSLNFGPQTTAVQILLDDLANDGSGAEGDNVLGGFEKLRGTAFGDTISGGAAAEQINGSDGDDSISGGGGADQLEGNRGSDLVNAVDGGADAAVLCDSPSDPAPAGTADVGYVDAADPAPQGCETVQGPAGGAPPPIVSPVPGAALPGPVLGAPVTTATVSRMPRVTGRPFASARSQVLRTIANAEIDLTFRRGCTSSTDLEVVKQTPLTGASLPNDARDPVAVTLTACLADRDFLRDCDLKDLRGDLRKLPKSALDAEVGLTLAKTVGRCKIDYDIRLQKAADEARIRLAAQQAETQRRAGEQQKAAEKAKRKAELKVGLSCPVPGDLRIAIADGYSPDRRALGLRASGPGGWTLPAGMRSFIELTVIDRALHFQEAMVYTDADEVSYLKPPPKKTVDGRVQIALDPLKGPGKIRLCVVQATGGDEVATGAVEITVVPRPANGTLWETTSGRRLTITKDGPVLAKAAARPVARASGLAEIWDLIVRVFSGTSRSIAAGPGGTAEQKRVRLVDTYSGPKYGAAQISLTGKLASDPAAPVVDLPAAADHRGHGRRRHAPGRQRARGRGRGEHRRRGRGEHRRRGRRQPRRPGRLDPGRPGRLDPRRHGRLDDRRRRRRQPRRRGRRQRDLDRPRPARRSRWRESHRTGRGNPRRCGRP